jgi:hypothetical protein
MGVIIYLGRVWGCLPSRQELELRSEKSSDSLIDPREDSASVSDLN